MGGEHKSELNELGYYARFKLALKFELALQYKEGSIAVKKDLKEMVRLLQLLAAEEYPPAQHELARCYYYGSGVDKDSSEALRLLRLAANKGDAEAQYNLGIFYLIGMQVEKDREKAVHWFRLSAAQGFAEAQYKLGRHEEGEGNVQEAVRLYRLASKQEYAEAQDQLGRLYEFGNGVPRDIKTAVSLYQSAAGKGDPGAQSNLARHYLQGSEGLKRNPKEAARLNRLAIEQGEDDRAKLNLAAQYLKGNGVEINEKEALRLIHSVSDQEDPDVKCALGVYHYIAKDYLLAGKFYMEAADKEQKIAKSFLGSCAFFKNLKTEEHRHSILHENFTPQESTEFLKEYKLFEEQLKSFSPTTLTIKGMENLKQKSEFFKNGILIMIASIQHMPKDCFAIIASYMVMDIGVKHGCEPKKEEESLKDSNCLIS